MTDSSQLTFDLSGPNSTDNYNEHDFMVLNEHQEAFDLLDKFCGQGDYSSANLPHLILKGEGLSGKTHLLNIFAKKYGFEVFNAREVREVEPISLFTGQKILAIDDVDELRNDNFLFHIYNLALENQALLLISLKNSEVFELRDLVSRLRNVVQAQIKSPDSDMIKILLSKGFSRRQLKIDAKIVDYLALNVARKYAAVEKVIDKIEEFAFQNKKKVTLADVKGIV